MKRYQAYVSLLLLVTLFFLIYPFQTTYAYFTDHTSVNGNISLKTGTLSLADIAASSLTFKTETKLPVTTVVKNTGSLDGKLTVKEISAIQDGKSVNYKEYFDVNVTFDDSNITASSIRNMTVIVTKKKDWAKEKLIELAIPVRISQRNVVGDQLGFIDQKIYRISLTNNSVEMPEWPKFEDNGYIAQPLYHSVVDGKLTTVVPGIVYLKSAKPVNDPKALFENSISIQRNGQSTIKPVVSKVDYIDKKGYRLELIHAENITHRLTDTDTMRFEFSSKLYQKLGYYYWGENGFSRAFIMDSEMKGYEPFFEETINVNLLTGPINKTFSSFDNIQNGLKSLTEEAKIYIKNHLTITTTDESQLKASFITNPKEIEYTGVQLKKGVSELKVGNVAQFQIKLGNKVVFERKVKHILEIQNKPKQEDKTDFEVETSQSSMVTSQEEHTSTIATSESQENSTTVEGTDSQMELTEDSYESDGREEIETDFSISSESLIEKGITLLPSAMDSEQELFP